jgi:hypothetical protein
VTCLPCEYDDPERMPEAMEAWACWQAAQACMRGGGMTAPHVDMGSALAMTAAAGVGGEVASLLLSAVQDGMSAGLAKRKGAA